MIVRHRWELGAVLYKKSNSANDWFERFIGVHLTTPNSLLE